MRTNLKIGLFGYGCVGQGLHDVFNSSKGFKAEIVKICVKNKNKKRRLSMDMFTFDKDEILNNEDINLVVELIDNAEEAFEIVTTAMKNGKSVVSANKKMIAEHFKELFELQQKHNVAFLYEASSCASIPIIRNLEEYYDNELLYSLRGIFNGSSNFILSKMYNNGDDYNIALKEAQDLGFAETDPSLDVEGIDAKYKLCIITGHAYGLFMNPEEIFHYGIQNISSKDIRYAKEKGYKIKLVPFVGKISDNSITSYVLPRFISPDKNLYNVEDEYNGVTAEGAFSDKQFFYGKGAGGHATGSAVLSDISANSYGYKYEYKKHNQGPALKYRTDIDIEIYLRYSNTEDRKEFAFDSISEKFYSEDTKYVIGVIKLDKLIAIKDKLQNMDVSIINTGRKLISYK